MENKQLVPTSTAMELIDARLEEQQLFGARECPHCGNKFSHKDWMGLPAGVKFDPTDQELIEHLQCKAEGDANRSHPLIDKFISTIDGEDGICYTHPEKLPGVTKDGLSRHFFHRPSKAYTTGTRKRRKIHVECEVQCGETRWHKTGKTRPVLVNGQQRGCKKILVLYTNFGKNRKPEKTNWVMHQYHLGVNEEEREGELVVSKIFYQTQPRTSAIEKTNVVSTPSAASGEASGGGSGSGDSSKEAAAMAANYGGGGYAGLDQIHPQLKADHFRFNPFSKVIDEGGAAGETSMAAGCGGNQIPTLSMSAATCVPNHQDLVTASAFHISRPTHSISQMISPPPLHHASIIHNPFQSPGLIIPNHSFQQQQQQQQAEEQQHHNMGGMSSASGLEEIIRSCNPSSDSLADHNQDTTIDQNQQEADWFKYSGFWNDPHNPSHHGQDL